jgi:Zn-dependent peptidase ImmA (M78 family)
MTSAADAFVDRCEDIALELRGELGLGDQARLDPTELAAHLAIDVHSIERFRDGLPDQVRRLTEEDVESFAAVTVFCGTRCLILVNPSQSTQEEALSVAHELAHLELEHEPTWPLFDASGKRMQWRANEEVEAEYLAEAMLAPRSGVSALMTHLGHDPTGIGERYGVGPVLMLRRFKATRRRTPAWPGRSLGSGSTGAELESDGQPPAQA